MAEPDLRAAYGPGPQKNKQWRKIIFKINIDQKQASDLHIRRKLNAVALISIESDILRQLNFGDIISSFISMNGRRKPISH